MKRRNIFKMKSGVLLLLLSLTACEKVLDTVPTDRININLLLSDPTGVQGFVTNAYDQLNSTFTGQNSDEMLDAFTDDAFKAGTSTSDFHNSLLTPFNSLFLGTVWNDTWMGIRKCNLALTYLPQSTVPKTAISDAQIKTWMNEVKLVRAWYHFMLIRTFGPIPFEDKEDASDFTDWSTLKRPTYDAIATRIAQECDDVIASGSLPLRWQISSDFDRVNLAVAYALKTNVLLFNASPLNNPTNDVAKWQKAADAAQACLIAIAPSYSLMPITSYDQLFSDAVTVADNETMLRSLTNDAGPVNNNNGVDLKNLGSSVQTNNCGSVPTQELVDCFELTNGALPVASYSNPDHTAATFNTPYSESSGSNPYAGRDKRLASSVVFNKTTYGRYKGQVATSPDLVIYTYLGKVGTGFQTNTVSQLQGDKTLSCTGYYGKKYRSASYWGTTAGGTNSNKIYFRLAEVYLNLAEAQCELNNLDAAMAALDVIRTRASQPLLANVPGYVKTQAFIRSRIRNERRVELCNEDHRFYDIRRWKILDQTMGSISGMKITSSNGLDNGVFSYQRVTIATSRSATSNKYLVFPIPNEEAKKLKGLGQPAAW